MRRKIFLDWIPEKNVIEKYLARDTRMKIKIFLNWIPEKNIIEKYLDARMKIKFFLNWIPKKNVIEKYLDSPQRHHCCGHPAFYVKYWRLDKSDLRFIIQ